MVRGSLAWFRRNAFRLHPSQRILRGLRPLVSVGPLPLTLPRVARHPNFPSPSETYLPIIIRHISYVQTCFLPIRLPPHHIIVWTSWHCPCEQLPLLPLRCVLTLSLRGGAQPRRGNLWNHYTGRFPYTGFYLIFSKNKLNFLPRNVISRQSVRDFSVYPCKFSLHG